MKKSDEPDHVIRITISIIIIIILTDAAFVYYSTRGKTITFWYSSHYWPMNTYNNDP